MSYGPPLRALLEYAEASNPVTSIDSSVLLTHTQDTITVQDKFPKSIFHYLVLPRLKRDDGSSRTDITASRVKELRSLLKGDKALAREVLETLARDAKEVKGMIETRMMEQFQFKWPIWIGFHSVQSMEHIHVHVMSADLISDRMKNKKHYNSFHPKLGFFLPLDEVLEWFELPQPEFESKAKLNKLDYEPKLKEDLWCFHCERKMKNIPLLKEHLKQEWDKMEKSAKAIAARSKRFEESRKKKEASVNLDSVSVNIDADVSEIFGDEDKKRKEPETNEGTATADTSPVSIQNAGDSISERPRKVMKT